MTVTDLDATLAATLRSWLDSANQADCDFPIQNLPFGIFGDARAPRAGVALGDAIVDLAALAEAGLLAVPGAD
ncbi:fumarylacetoacetase, partial [Burkholderia sp. Tr-860]|nr:fumarylacetoacetase [Burkholderia sp. Tr-860]